MQTIFVSVSWKQMAKEDVGTYLNFLGLRFRSENWLEKKMNYDNR